MSSRWYHLSVSAKSRTEQAIVAAAVRTWASERAATLPEIAEAAAVGRTTLHRYFPVRDGLVRAAVRHALESVGAAIAEAQPETGHPLDAMRRVVAALASVSEAIMFVFGDQSLMRDVVPTAQPDLPTPRDPVIELIRRGQAEGVFDSEVTAEWMQQVLWGISYTAFEQVAQGSLAKFEVVATVNRTLERGITALPGGLT
ncbi:TetR/AcrR family transcriptional regulator [Rhodococcus sp. SBT000017]|nr:TetR/AcrR family transcriptional regulator [Rhodococcus sp. SBT000017]